MTETDMITIPRAMYEDFLDTERWLDALMAAGVDNWDGYDNALEILEKWNEEIENNDAVD